MYTTASKWIQYAAKRPHEFTIQYPNSPQYFQENFRRTPVNPEAIFSKDSDLLLYLHLPFCAQKCAYCNFAVDTNKSRMESYVDALLKEYDLRSGIIDKSNISGIDIGGGTPTVLPLHLLELVLNKIEHLIPDNDPNFASIETTPTIASGEIEKLIVIRDNKFKRISMGIQSANSEVLKTAKRSNGSSLQAAAKNIFATGFERFNVDLIFGLQEQTLEAWINDLETAISLAPTSITTYDCLYSREGRRLGNAKIPSPGEYGQLYDVAYELLLKNGYYADYGSVNFSAIPDESGTSKYFEGRILRGESYIGLGNYATSMKNQIWYFNTHSTEEYIKRINSGEEIIDDFYILPTIEVATKHILANLNYGFIDRHIFKKKFAQNVEVMFGTELDFLEDMGCMEFTSGSWDVANMNFKNMNYIRSMFYSRQAREYMMENTK